VVVEGVAGDDILFAPGIEVAFEPLTNGLKVASLEVVTNSAINPLQVVPLTGTGLAPNAVLAPTSLVFSGQALNSTSLAKAVTLTNRGSSTLLNIGVTTTGNFSRSFAGVNSCGGSLNVGASCNIYVTFRPTAGGTRTGTLVVTSTDPVNPTQSVTLSGYGNFAAARAVSITASPAGSASAGTTATFTALGSGAGTGAVYSYRFWFFDGNGWTMVQDYSTTATWTWAIPVIQVPGLYGVQVDVRTNTTVTRDATNSISYTVDVVPPATGATLVATPPGSSAAGTAVLFTAQGTGSTATYEYQFWLFDGLTWSMVQDWSLAPSWTWNIPATGSSGAYTVEALVRTSPWVVFDVSAQIPYTVP